MKRQQQIPIWHTCSPEQVLEQLDVCAATGLSRTEVTERLKVYGDNQLQEQAGRSPWYILWEQLTSTMALILTAAALVSGLVGSGKDALTICTIVLLFALLGFVQDYRAERAIAALQKLAVPLVRVRRNGVVVDIPAQQLVPGDILLMDAGSVVSADCRLLEAHALRVQEAVLTGESEAVEKLVEAIESRDIPLGDRRNLLFMGTLVSAGRAVAVVVATGMQTELGNIATLLQQVEHEWTPLQKRLDRLGKVLAVVSILVAALVFAIGLLRGEGLKEMLLLAVSVAVAAIPEGLPAVVTITLALGAQRMLKKQALIRRLPAVETLGSVTVICSDKTGTLTQNRMAVTRLMNTDEMLFFSPLTPLPEGEGGQRPGERDSQKLLLMIGALCNDAVLKVADGEESVLGDPTEGALISAAAAAGIFRGELEQTLPRIAEIPFDSVSKRMITVHAVNGLAPGPWTLDPLPLKGKLLAAKGALDAILGICNRVLVMGTSALLTDRHRDLLQAAADRYSDEGQRVLALAVRTLQPEEDDRLEQLQQQFICIGLVALSDPPRDEAKKAVQQCLAAGIRPVMITGDHPLTARAIARHIGIDDTNGVLTGLELDQLPVDEFDEAVGRISVYARVAPEHKLRIVESIQRQGGVAAMTGDGVNDAPALKKADVGVAMGKVGTDVAREAADMVLLDDNFATIVAAVEEGRTIYDNIRKFVVFSVAGNTGKILAVLVLPFLGLPMPLTPLQLLWLNLLTDGLLGLGMGVERPEPDNMQRPPISSTSQIFDGRTIRYVLLTGSLIGGSCMFVTLLVWHSGGPWQTILFASLAFAQIAQAMALRSFRNSFFSMGLFRNPLLLAMAAAVLLLQGVAVYLPQLQQFFRTATLSLDQLWLVVVPALLVFVVLEGEKWASRIMCKQ
jgi:Ca2+-transporting ATPase